MQTFRPRFLVVIISNVILSAFSACSANQDNANTTATTNVAPPPIQTLRVVPRPQKIAEMMNKRGQLDEAQPVVKIVSPASEAGVNGSVSVRLTLSGDLKGYKPYKDPATGMGDHIHVVLDNEPYEAYYDLGQPFELKNVAPGKHTLRVFASRPWHEAYKNEGAFQMVSFTVKGSDHLLNFPSRKKDNNSQTAGEMDATRPLLTYSRPKGEYKGDESDPIMIDFWLSNAKLKGDGGEFRVRYIIDDDEPQFLDYWEPIWLSGWLSAKHTVRLELLGPDKWPLKGDSNVTTREIRVVR